MSKHSLLGSRSGFGNWNRDLFTNLHREIDRVFGDFSHLPSAEAGTAVPGSTLLPRTDIRESENAIIVEAEMPGVDKDRIEVRADDSSLTIDGRKDSESRRDEDDYHLIERSSGRFHRRIPLGFTVDPDSVKAELSNGVLNVRIPKPAESEQASRRIEVKQTAAEAGTETA